jgi:hypothetical protein
MDIFLLGPVPEIEDDSKTSKGVLFAKTVAKALWNFLSCCYQKVKKVTIFGTKSLMNFLFWSYQKCTCSQLKNCFAVFIIFLIFLAPTIFYDRLYNLDFRFCKAETYEIHITAKDITCKGWFEFRYGPSLYYFSIFFDFF